MMRSVSTLGRSMGAATAVSDVKACMAGRRKRRETATSRPPRDSGGTGGARTWRNPWPAPVDGHSARRSLRRTPSLLPPGAERAHVREATRHRRGSRHRRPHQVRAHALALAALEVSVRRRGHALARPRRVAVDPDAHRAAGLAPLEPGVAEDAVEPLGLRRLL